MPDIVDVSFACGDHAGFLAGAGIRTIVRYYSRDTGIPAKRLSASEAQAFARAGLRISVVHEGRHGDQLRSFNRELGALDGGYARDYAERVINQPAGSAIYFGVDLDPTDEQITGNIRPYFEGVRGALRENGDQRYKIGVYGSGATCAAILDAQLAEFAWLAQSTGWRDYKAFRDSNRWSLRQLASTKVGEIECDGDVAGANGFGDFQLTTESVATGERLETVIAKSGLRLRSGPGIDFDVLNILPFGSRVHVVKTVGDWALVDLSGSGGADGFVNSHFLG